MDTFELANRHELRAIEGIDFTYTSMQFHFRNKKPNGYDPSTLIFAKKDKIYELNYETCEVKDICIFEQPLSRQPTYFLMNNSQNKSIIASQDDGLFYNHDNKETVDMT